MQNKFTAVLFLAAAACGGAKPATTPAKPAEPAKTVVAANADVVKAELETKVKAPPAGPTVVTTISAGLATPESVLYDVENDRYLISNINGTPLTVDNNGYIATLAADGTTVEKWIVGGANKVTLNAPKGMAIAGGVLYVTDITTVRKFDLKTGAAKGEIKIAGATFLNDLAVGSNDVLYVSDSGLKAGKADFEPTGTDAVYKIDTKAKTAKAAKVAKDKSLDKPNGLLVNAANQVWVAPFGSNSIYMIDDAGKKSTTVQLPGGGLDGILDTGKHIMVSSWEKSTVYAAATGGATLTFAPLIENVSSPADIGYDSKRNRLMIPRFIDSKVEIYQLPTL
ncbi:MAG: hypothetical protein KBG15_12590 [Kofleriaceae bacterium]|nr:hypothetical protein [Kofleriaceae bacterium]